MILVQEVRAKGVRPGLLYLLLPLGHILAERHSRHGRHTHTRIKHVEWLGMLKHRAHEDQTLPSGQGVSGRDNLVLGHEKAWTVPEKILRKSSLLSSKIIL